MAKTRSQEMATSYAHSYMEQVFKIEDIMGWDLDSRIENAVKKYMEDRMSHADQQ
jgi:hypothetical protein